MNLRVAILVSGDGTTLKYFLDQDPEERNFEIALVLADVWCPAIEIARRYGVPVVVIGKALSKDRFTRKVLAMLRLYDISLVVMAGFMRLLGPAMFMPDMFLGRVLNLHPSLLPLFPGRNAIEQTLRARPRPKESGCSVIIADAGEDTGRVFTQAKVPVYSFDTVGTLRTRIQEKEKPLYYDAVREYVELILEW